MNMAAEIYAEYINRLVKNHLTFPSQPPIRN